jgi:hypothetical protein
MKSMQYVGAVSAAALLTATLIAGCGGGGGSTLPGPGPRPSPSLSPSPSPEPSPVLQAMGMQVATGGTFSGGFTYAPANAEDIVFTCGCFPQAGTSVTDANGAFTVTSPATPTPAGSPYVMVAGRNYVVVAEPPSGAGPQGWTLMFEGHTPATTLALGDSGSVLASAATSDVFTTAAALYVYKKSAQCPASGCNTAFDDWNLNTVQAWVQHLEASPNNAERTMLNDIAAQSAANASLFPAAPLWNPVQPLNPTINADLNAVSGSEASIPTPCPGGPAGCTGTPTP